MRALNSHVVLIDLHCTSWQRNNNKHLLFPTTSNLNNFNLLSSFRRSPKRIQCSKSYSSSPEIRRPSDRYSIGNGSSPLKNSENPATAELYMFLELLPLKMRKELYEHSEIGGLIEVVMDLGRKPLARFPSGDWVISQQPITHDDLRHAISMVLLIFLFFNGKLFSFNCIYNVNNTIRSIMKVNGKSIRGRCSCKSMCTTISLLLS